jgi:DNA-nicking Smr family endonuclease
MPRRRDLTGEERSLWGRVTDTARPLDRRRTGAKADSAETPRPEVRPAAGTPTGGQTQMPDSLVSARVRPAPRAMPAITVDLAPDPMLAALAATPAMDRARYDDLRRGKLRPEARIDLHGMTADRAHRELSAFIHRAHAQDRRLVLVITGKGRQSAEDTGPMPSRVGILRHALPRWLSLPDLKPMVLDLVPAHLRHGGSGAWYVYLRRRK